MITRAAIIRAETEFPRDWATHVIELPWGLLYHTPEIPDSHDGNHAHILHSDDPVKALREMTVLYTNWGVTPRVYHLGELGDPQSAELRAIAAEQGFRLFGVGATTRFFIHECQATPSRVALPGLTVRRITEPMPVLMEMIEVNDGLRFRKVVQRRLALPQYHLLGAFLRDEPVAICSLHQMPNLTRVDDVLTAVSQRGKGIGRTLIQQMVTYHTRHMSGPVYLYAENPVAIRAYLAAGFVELLPPFDFWSAWRESTVTDDWPQPE